MISTPTKPMIVAPSAGHRPLLEQDDDAAMVTKSTWPKLDRGGLGERDLHHRRGQPHGQAEDAAGVKPRPEADRRRSGSVKRCLRRRRRMINVADHLPDQQDLHERNGLADMLDGADHHRIDQHRREQQRRSREDELRAAPPAP